MQNTPEWDPRLLEQIATTPMPFGKYEGRLIVDLPAAYLEWFARKGFPRSRLGQMLATAHEIRMNGLDYLLDPLRQNKS